MEKRISALKLNGTSLHQTFFVKDKSYHDFLHFYKVDSKFEFDIKGLKGQCVMSIGFTDYGLTKNVEAEMEVTIRNMSFDDFLRGVHKLDIKQTLLKEIENQKLENFKKYICSQ